MRVCVFLFFSLYIYTYSIYIRRTYSFSSQAAEQTWKEREAYVKMYHPDWDPPSLYALRKKEIKILFLNTYRVFFCVNCEDDVFHPSFSTSVFFFFIFYCACRRVSYYTKATTAYRPIEKLQRFFAFYCIVLVFGPVKRCAS